METEVSMRRIQLLRDLAVGATAATAVSIQLVASNWFLAGLALIVAAGWLVGTRRRSDLLLSALPAIGLCMAVLIVVRLSEPMLPVAVAGTWALVCALDLERLARRYPDDSPILDQRMLVRRRLLHLGALGVASAVVTALARTITVPFRMTALLLLIAFVVVVIGQVTKRLTR
jgi:hypothetical protein